MYSAPGLFKTMVDDFTNSLGSKDKAQLLIFVELTLTLARQLGLDGEPVTIGWCLLSRIPLQHIKLNRLTPMQRRMLANAAFIVPLSSRVAWERALVRYSKEISEQHQLYRIQPLPLDDQIIDAIYQQPSRDLPRERRYEAILSATLNYELRNRHETILGETYRVRAKGLDGNMHWGRVTIEDMPANSVTDHVWFEDARPRTVISLNLDDLRPTAMYLDEWERRTGGREHWDRDLRQIRFRKAVWVDDQVSLEMENTHPLHLQGMVHLPGMVSAGKTTLAKLIIAHCLCTGMDVRITLVVGDSHTAIETAHQINSWFYDDPNGAEVAAVPLLGATQRETHLGRLFSSREYARAKEAGKPHWGERWLMPVCPLAAAIQWEAGEDVVMAAGSEPCEGLIEDVRNRRRKGKRHVCPLFQHCPSKQLYRDMPRARVWVTTPGALAQAALPLSLDRRILKMGDLVYEQSDLVILDEVETIVDWFDRTYARREALTSGGDGLLDKLDRQISQYWNNNRVLPVHERRWIIPARESIKVLSSVLTAIDDPDQKRTVKDWVKSGYFSPNQLAYRLARRLAGLKEWDSADLLPETRNLHNKMTDEAFEPFNTLLNQIPDPLRHQIPPLLEDASEVDQLAGMMQAINNLSEDVTDDVIAVQCQRWVLRWHPDAENRLAALQAQLEESDSPYDNVYVIDHCDRSTDEMAQRLHFLLMVALLDRHIHIMLQEWHNKPEALEAAQPFSRIPRGMRPILPLPLTGQQYGFMIDTSSRHQRDEARNRLSLFAYTNIGRSYLLDFHRLREDLEDTPGPHVLALSGTSYLPDSTPFHVALQPSGVLIAPPETEAAINDSRFIWRYFRDENGNPIHVSGRDDKDHQLTLLMLAMLDDGGTTGGFLARTLRKLETLAEKHPAEWEDRGRLLLLTNSYKQAAAAAQTLRNRWPEAASDIFNLRQGREEDYQVEGLRNGDLKRIDIEQFAATGGRILIAPMQAIGRGFNILNTRPEAKAAFGAVFFLTRPLNPPHDMEAMAQELNRYALEWGSNPDFGAWQTDTLYKRALNARDSAMKLRRLIMQRRGYTDLMDDVELGVYPRRDLAATTAGRIVQAVGRLLRGGVPFYAYFVDAAWSPELAKLGDPNESEAEETSLLTAVINVLSEYADRDAIGEHLYGGLSEALITTENRDSN